MRLNQLTLGVTDFDEAVRFYEQLGLRLIVSARGEYARFELPEGEATLSLHLQPEAPRNGPVVYFEVDDVDAVVARLRDSGMIFDDLPTDQPWLWREARLTDPSGNRLCLFRAGEARRYPPWRISATPPPG